MTKTTEEKRKKNIYTLIDLVIYKIQESFQTIELTIGAFLLKSNQDLNLRHYKPFLKYLKGLMIKRKKMI